MSSKKFVRSSSFRHVHGVPAKTDDQYLQLPIATNGDGNFIAANSKFFCYAGKGGGGPVHVQTYDQKGRYPLNAPKIAVHKAKVLDFAFSPFVDTLLATSSEDCYTKICNIPEGGLTENITTATQTLSGHEKKVSLVKFHPTANNVLSTASHDHTVKVWDIETGAETLSYGGFEDSVFGLDWNRNGSEMATISKDKKIRIFDPRGDTSSVTTINSHEGTKKSSVFWLSKIGLLGSVGFTRSSTRQIHIWDPRKIEAKPLSVIDIDQSAGVFIAHYDHDTSMLYLAGKGDSSVRYYEMVSEAPYAHFLTSFSDNSSQKGFCFLPKAACDTSKCEIARGLRLMQNSVVPVSFQVPRKSDLFQKDLYPEAYAGIPALECKEWLAGDNKDPVLTSMKPGEGIKNTATFVAKKSYAELEAELAAALKKIAELEAK